MGRRWPQESRPRRRKGDGGVGTISFIDSAFEETDRKFCGCRAFGATRYLLSLKGRGCYQYLVSIGKNNMRAACFQRASEHGLLPATLVHPAAVVSESARLGDGTVVMARAVINAEAQIGKNCIVNTAAVVEHDCQIGDHVHLSPGALLGGNVTVHSFAHLGIGAIALPGSQGGVLGHVSGKQAERRVVPWTPVVLRDSLRDRLGGSNSM